MLRLLPHHNMSLYVSPHVLLLLKPHALLLLSPHLLLLLHNTYELLLLHLLVVDTQCRQVQLHSNSMLLLCPPQYRSADNALYVLYSDCEKLVQSPRACVCVK